MESELLFWALPLGIGAGVVLLAVWLGPLVLPRLRQKVVWQALEPLAYAAIVEAYQASEAAVDAGLARLHGVDKELIAQYLYGFLPDSIVVRGIRLPLDWVMPFNRWLDLVEAVFDKVTKLLFAGREDMHEDFYAWLRGMFPGIK